MNIAMKHLTREELWQRLQQQSLVAGELPPINAASTPWYVRVMLGIAGWIGAMFLLGFVGVGFYFVMKSTAAMLIIGALSCGAAYAIFRAARDRDFGMQFGLAVSIAGQSLIIIGLFNEFKSHSSTLYLLIAVFQAALTVLIPNFIHRVLTSAGAVFALAFALISLGLYGVAGGVIAVGLAWVWTDQQRWLGNGALWRPIGYGLTLALLQIESTRLLDPSMMLWAMTSDIGWWMQHGWWIGTGLVTVALMWSVTRMLAQENVAVSSSVGIAAILAAVAVGALSLRAPGIATALLILLLGFSSGNRILMGLGLLALLGFVSHYYYQMQSTLLVKSMVLAVSGGALLLVRLVLQHIFPMQADTEESHA